MGIDVNSRRPMWLPQTRDIRLNPVFHKSWKISTRAENSYDALSRKPISEGLIDSCINKRLRALCNDFICASDTKNIPQVI